MPSHVLRIPRSDEEGSFVLARATASSQASKPLDVRLVATEGESPYSVSLRHDRIDKSRYQSAPCSPDEWEAILKFLLLGQGWVDNIDATATVKEESDVTITIRKRVQNITQRLGTLSLAYDEAEGIELFDWCGDAVDSRAQAQQALEEATAKQSTLQAAVDDLKAQLDEFLTTKDSDETAMLEKFCTLLNEKKVKIRVQQKMLANAAQYKSRADDIAEIKEEEEEEPALPTTRGTRKTTKADSSGSKQKPAPAKRGAKRSAAAAAVSEPDEDSDDDDFEQTASRGTRSKGKGKGNASAQDSDDQEDLDESTDSGDAATESDDDGGAEPMDEDDDNNDAGPAKTTAAPVPEEGPPPRRVLAFGKARVAADGASSSAAPASAVPAPPAAKPAPAPTGDSDTDSDDEL